MSVQELDNERVEAFAGRALGVVNDAMVALMMSIGHRTGLFDAMAGMEAGDAAAIAATAGLQERYVREWLGAMVTGGIVEHDGELFRLPPEHAASLTRAAGPEQHRLLRPVRRDARQGRGRHRRLLQERRRRAVLAVPGVPAVDGRGQCDDLRRHAARRRGAAGARTARAARPGHRRRRRRLRVGARHQPVGGGLSRRAASSASTSRPRASRPAPPRPPPAA